MARPHDPMSFISISLPIVVVILLIGCQPSESREERLRLHYEEVIVPETEAPLASIAKSCSAGDTDACQTFGVLSGEVMAVRLGRYWEAMHWLGVEKPGNEIIPELLAIGDDCEYLASLYALDEQSVSGMCSYFRDGQLPYKPASASSDRDETRPTESVGFASESLTEEDLRNGTYPSEWTDSGTVTLVEGSFELAGESIGSSLTVRLLDEIGLGDLDGDGEGDAAVVIATNGGGSGTFYELLAVIRDDGANSTVARQSLGDRVVIESLAIVGERIELKMIAHGPNDALCCPSVPVTRTYDLTESGLSLVDLP